MAAQRHHQVIRSDAPNGPTGDDDVYTRFTYAAGMQTSMWVDLDGDNAVDSDDQVTTYTYGVVKGASAADSKISSNRLLKKATYPEQYSMQAAADREVNFAYNAQGQEVYKKDQATNVIETVYDTGGRVTTRKFTTINTGAGFDDAVKRIEMAYLGRGLADTVTQYDATSSGTALDQVQYSYDDWGNLTKFEQDPDSAIGGGGRAAYSVQYTLSKSAPAAGRQTVRRDTVVYPGNLTLTYNYGTGSGTNDTLSRVGPQKGQDTRRRSTRRCVCAPRMGRSRTQRSSVSYTLSVNRPLHLTPPSRSPPPNRYPGIAGRTKWNG